MFQKANSKKKMRFFHSFNDLCKFRKKEKIYIYIGEYRLHQHLWFLLPQVSLVYTKDGKSNIVPQYKAQQVLLCQQAHASNK